MKHIYLKKTFIESVKTGKFIQQSKLLGFVFNYEPVNQRKNKQLNYFFFYK